MQFSTLTNNSTRIAALICAALLTATTFAANKSAAPPWPQNSSDLKPDPALKFGALPNGMRYIVMHNNMPANAVSLRLHMDTGSMQENGEQQGVAHLLEHMAFRGSKHVPDGEVDKTLQRIGLQFGADTNAFTSHTQTAYKFDLPNGTDANIDTGLMLLREVASELNITNDALKTERGVVLSEKRLRDTAEQRAGEDEITAMLPGMRAPSRWPIGKEDILLKVDAKTVRSYYEAYYHPERATLIVVGNVDPGVIAKKITARFSDWKPAKRSAANPDFGTLKPVTNTRIYVEAGLPTAISLDFADAYDSRATTRFKRREDTIRNVGLNILNLRFQQLALGSDAPFTNASANYAGNLMHSASGISVNIDTTPEKWQSGLQAAQQAINNVLKQGVRQDEVDRVVANYRTNLQTAIAGANTRRTQSLADNLVYSLDNNDVVLSPQQNAEVVEAVLNELKADAVTTALRTAFTGTNKMVFMTSATPIDGGEAKVASVYKEAVNSVSAATEAKAVAAWPYSNFGKPGTVVKQQKLDDLDATVVRFNNGVTLVVKRTAFTQGQVEVWVKTGNGMLGLDNRKANASFLTGSLSSGGLEAIDFTTMQQALAGKTYRTDVFLNEDNVTLRGVTTPADIDTQLQVLTAYASASAFRAGAFEQLRNLAISEIAQVETQPLSYLQQLSAALVRSNDPRWAFPTVQQLKDAKLENFRAWLEPQLEQGSIEVNIVGDISVDRAIAATAATVGALPTRPAATLRLSAANEIKFPAATQAPLVLRHTGGKDQAAVTIAWPTADRRTSLEELADLQLLSAIIRSRMIDAMRPQSGSSYTASARYDGSWNFVGFGTMQIMSDIKPEQTKVFFDTVNTMIDELRKTPVSADEFARARLPMLAGIDKAHQNNGFYAQLMVPPDVDPKLYEWIVKQADYVKAVTPERIQAAAQKYLVADKAWTAVMVPQENVNATTK